MNVLVGQRTVSWTNSAGFLDMVRMFCEGLRLVRLPQLFETLKYYSQVDFEINTWYKYWMTEDRDTHSTFNVHPFQVHIGFAMAMLPELARCIVFFNALIAQMMENRNHTWPFREPGLVLLDFAVAR